jgi:hypothetical protein
MIVPEGFCSVGLDDPAASDTLQHKIHQHNSKSDIREEKSQNTSTLTSSLELAPSDVSSTDVYHH